MKIKFPRGIEIDINNVPDNFEEIIKNSFHDYTYRTPKEYRYRDKLAYIDRCRELVHDAEDEYDAVNNFIKQTFSDRLDEFEEFTDKADFVSIDFMVECYKKGEHNLYANYTYSDKLDGKIMKLLERAIKVVINYQS